MVDQKRISKEGRDLREPKEKTPVGAGAFSKYEPSRQAIRKVPLEGEASGQFHLSRTSHNS
jgi:hypothetical protein